MHTGELLVCNATALGIDTFIEAAAHGLRQRGRSGAGRRLTLTLTHRALAPVRQQHERQRDDPALTTGHHSASPIPRRPRHLSDASVRKPRPQLAPGSSPVDEIRGPVRGTPFGHTRRRRRRHTVSPRRAKPSRRSSGPRARRWGRRRSKRSATVAVPRGGDHTGEVRAAGRVSEAVAPLRARVVEAVPAPPCRAVPGTAAAAPPVIVGTRLAWSRSEARRPTATAVQWVGEGVDARPPAAPPLALSGHARARVAVAVTAVRRSVAIVVQTISASRRVTLGPERGALGIGAVQATVAVVVSAVRTALGRVLLDHTEAVTVRAVHPPVTIIVCAVGAQNNRVLEAASGTGGPRVSAARVAPARVPHGACVRRHGGRATCSQGADLPWRTVRVVGALEARAGLTDGHRAGHAGRALAVVRARRCGAQLGPLVRTPWILASPGDALGALGVGGVRRARHRTAARRDEHGHGGRTQVRSRAGWASASASAYAPSSR